MGQISMIVIHCSDSPDGLDIGAAEIKRWHTDPPPHGRGWKDIGYQYVVRRSGQVETGRYHNGDSVLEGKEIGAHARGHNSIALSICLVGRINFDKTQIRSAVALTRTLMDHHNLKPSDVLGHCELDPHKTCPNINMHEFRQKLGG